VISFIDREKGRKKKISKLSKDDPNQKSVNTADLWVIFAEALLEDDYRLLVERLRFGVLSRISSSNFLLPCHGRRNRNEYIPSKDQIRE
jgi:hypothetical protein